MSQRPKPLDDNERLIAGTLPMDPFADTVELLEEPSEESYSDGGVTCASDDDAPGPPQEEDGRKTIVINNEEHRVNMESIVALRECEGLYQRSGRLVEVILVDGRRVIRDLPRARVRWLLASRVNYVIERKDENEQRIKIPVHVPEWCTKAVESAGQWPGILRLVGLLEAPALRPDGTVLQDPGLDGTGYLYIPSVEFPRVAERPTREDAVRARDELLEIVRDFPFATDAHRAAWLAYALTPFARPAFEGNSPLIGVDATTRGTGKGRLVDATGILAIGRDPGKTPQPKDDEEMRKRITSILREGESIHVIDNVARRLDDASLDAVATATTWKDRALGRNETFNLPNLTLWVATGNNLEFGADTARRTLHIRLESPHENPEDRNDFLHPDLLAWIRAERPRLVAAALTILRAYVVAGRPHMGCKSWGSFEGWSRLISHAVVWVGMADPQSTRTELERVNDTAKAALVSLIFGWERLCIAADNLGGMTARAAINYLYPVERLRGLAKDDEHDDLREAIGALVPTPSDKQPISKRLANHIQRARGRVISGRMFDGVPGKGGIVRWRVVVASERSSSSSLPSSIEGGPGGVGGSIAPRQPCACTVERDPVSAHADGQMAPLDPPNPPAAWTPDTQEWGSIDAVSASPIDGTVDGGRHEPSFADWVDGWMRTEQGTSS